jgi:hypothetical protein
MNNLLSRIGQRTKHYWLLVLAMLLILSPAMFDIPSLGSRVVGLKFTLDAVTGLVGVLVTARLVEAWSKRRADERDRERFNGISTIAYRSLSQCVNDVGRTMIAPLIGADLFSAGIPGSTSQEHQRNLLMLASVGLDPAPRQTSGFWDELDSAQMFARLELLGSRPEFAEVMFLATASARRRLQDSMADWAPVMITVPLGVERLEPGMALADRLVLLAESWRSLALLEVGSETENRSACLSRAMSHYQETIKLYRLWLAELQPLAKLPSRGFQRLTAENQIVAAAQN